MQFGESSYRLRIRAISWSGKGRDAKGYCCETIFRSFCGDYCDNYFRFCVRPRGYDSNSDACPGGSYQTGVLGGNSIVNFRGVPSPMIFTGGSWPVSSAANNYYCFIHLYPPHAHAHAHTHTRHYTNN